MFDDTVRPEATLLINRSDSRCSLCGKNASPESITHRMVRGRVGEGCGALFTSVSSEDLSMNGRAQAMRPDLPFIDIRAMQSAGARKTR